MALVMSVRSACAMAMAPTARRRPRPIRCWPSPRPSSGSPSPGSSWSGCLPVGLRLLGAAPRPGRGLVAGTASRLPAGYPGKWHLAVLIVALTATMVGTFASALLDRISTGTTAASWQLVGADFQVTGRGTTWRPSSSADRGHRGRVAGDFGQRLGEHRAGCATSSWWIRPPSAPSARELRPIRRSRARCSARLRARSRQSSPAAAKPSGRSFSASSSPGQDRRRATSVQAVMSEPISRPRRPGSRSRSVSSSQLATILEEAALASTAVLVRAPRRSSDR